MQVVKETLSPCQISLQITVEPEKISEAVNKAYREYSKYITVPGFRKGHAPLALVKPRIPEKDLNERTAELLSEPAYVEAVKQEDIKPFAPPSLELVEISTKESDYKFEFKAVVPLAPKVVLGTYKELEVIKPIYEVTDEVVTKRIDQNRLSGAAFPIVEGRGAEKDDLLVVDLAITPDGASEPASSQSTLIMIGDENNIEGLDEQALGLTTGDEKSFRLACPEGFRDPAVAGQEAGFYLKVKEHRHRELPELTDEFAKQFGAETVDELKAKIHEDLEKQLKGYSENIVENKLVEKVVEGSQIDYPEVMAQEEIRAQFQSLAHSLEHRKMTFENYLASVGKTQEQLLEQFKTEADLRIKRGLVLGEISKTESIGVEESDIDAEIARQAEENHTTVEAIRAYIDANKQTPALTQNIYLKKVLGFLVSTAIITEKTLDIDQDPEA
jgi:trigger factor